MAKVLCPSQGVFEPDPVIPGSVPADPHRDLANIVTGLALGLGLEPHGQVESLGAGVDR
jgi:hypothetical protein